MNLYFLQEITGQSVQLAYVDQGYTGQAAKQAAQTHGIQLEVLNAPKRNTASSSCRADGWLSAALPGPHASGAWHETINALPKPSPDFTTSLLLASCFIGSFRSSRLHDTL